MKNKNRIENQNKTKMRKIEIGDKVLCCKTFNEE